MSVSFGNCKGKTLCEKNLYKKAIIFPNHSSYFRVNSNFDHIDYLLFTHFVFIIFQTDSSHGFLLNNICHKILRDAFSSNVNTLYYLHFSNY